MTSNVLTASTAGRLKCAAAADVKSGAVVRADRGAVFCVELTVG